MIDKVIKLDNNLEYYVLDGIYNTKKCGTWSKKNNTCRDGKKHCKI